MDSESKKSKLQKEILGSRNRNCALTRLDVKKRLNQLLQINSEIGPSPEEHRRHRQDIDHIDGNIGLLKAQLKTLEEQLAERKAKYVKSMRYIARKPPCRTVSCSSSRQRTSPRCTAACVSCAKVCLVPACAGRDGKVEATGWPTRPPT